MTATTPSYAKAEHLGLLLNPIYTPIAQLLQSAIQSVFNLTLPLIDLAQPLSFPPDATLGDVAFPCFSLAKTCKKAPPQITQLLLEHLNNQLNAAAQGFEIKSAGAFLNFTLLPLFFELNALNLQLHLKKNDTGFLYRLPPNASPSALYPDPNVMVEYSQPNTHKSFHIGHVRNVCLGDSLQKIMRFCGFNVISANYIGDVGTHVAKFLWYYLDKLNSPLPPQNQEALSLSLGVWLGDIYQKATAAEEELGEPARKRIGEILTQLTLKQEPVYSAWLKTKQWSMDDFLTIYKELNAQFNVWFYESDVEDASQEIVDEYLQKGIFAESQEAIGIDLSTQKLGFCLLRKKDGNTLYATKDLALARKKFNEFSIDRSIYVVDSAQSHHFRQVFATLVAMGFEKGSRCFHLSYGRVVLPDGKMSSRTGNVVLYKSLRDELKSTLHAQYQQKEEFTQDPQLTAEVINHLCLGAIRYGMIKIDPEKEITFDAQDWTSLEGATGTYVQYTGTRMNSVLRKLEQAFGESTLSAYQQNSKQWKFEQLSKVETQLWHHLALTSQVIGKAADDYRPSLVARFAFELSQVFNQFYAEHNLLRETHEQVRNRRWYLVTESLKALKTLLQLIGVEIPCKM